MSGNVLKENTRNQALRSWTGPERRGEERKKRRKWALFLFILSHFALFAFALFYNTDKLKLFNGGSDVTTFSYRKITFTRFGEQFECGKDIRCC